MTTAKRSEHPRVLVVEDDDAVGKVLRLSLRRGGFDTAEAESGGEALRIMERSTFEAVVLDLCLPDGLGGAVLQQLQGVLPGGHPVWVVMSALDEDEATRRFGPLQGPFLAKPFDPYELVDTLTGLLSDASSHPGRMKAESRPPAGPDRERA